MSRRKLIHYNPEQAGRLRCDTPGCGHVEPHAQPFTEALIGQPCPLCGASLLTRKDYADTKRLFAMIDTMNRWFGWLGSETPSPSHKAVEVRTHNGELTIRVPRDGD